MLQGRMTSVLLLQRSSEGVSQLTVYPSEGASCSRCGNSRFPTSHPLCTPSPNFPALAQFPSSSSTPTLGLHHSPSHLQRANGEVAVTHLCSREANREPQMLTQPLFFFLPSWKGDDARNLHPGMTCCAHDLCILPSLPPCSSSMVFFS